MRICDACGSPAKGGIVMGAALICRSCSPDIEAEIEATRAAGKPVNVLHIAKSRFRDLHGTPGVFQVRDLPPGLKDQMDRAALDQGISLRELTLKALYQYLGE